MRRPQFQPFPQTRASVVDAVRSADEDARSRAFGAVAEAYWRPVYTHLRARWGASDEEASDLTQEFFSRALEKGFFEVYDPSRARFRTFVRVCVDRFAANARTAGARQKRGGGATHVPLETEGEDGELRRIEPVAVEDSPDERFRREWVRGLFALAVGDVRAWTERVGRPEDFTIFERYDLDDDDRATYAALASDLGVTPAHVTNRLAAARREFRRAVLARLRETCGGEDEFRAEARALLGLEIR